MQRGGGVPCVLASGNQPLIAQKQSFRLRRLQAQVRLHPHLGRQSGELPQLSRNGLLLRRRQIASGQQRGRIRSCSIPIDGAQPWLKFTACPHDLVMKPSGSGEGRQLQDIWVVGAGYT